VDEETVVHGYLALADAMSAVAARRDDEAMRVGGRAVEVGMRFSDPNLTALALQLMGRVELRRGNTDAGLTLLDEAMVTVASGSLMPAVAGIVYCSVIDGCRSAYAIRRVHEWTEALTRWCERQPQLVTFTGECRGPSAPAAWPRRPRTAAWASPPTRSPAPGCCRRRSRSPWHEVRWRRRGRPPRGSARSPRPSGRRPSRRWPTRPRAPSSWPPATPP